ncbi:hypothetical protein J6590_046224 [Homalodisca vitripennis]|nr:hypothetical protein J6590_046224 [Homalodisca vitripennis]
MALFDANYKFTMVDVGGYGKASNDGVFGRFAMGAKFETQELDIPEPRPLQNMRFRVLYGRLQVTPKNADIIVLTCMALHNLLRNEVVHEQWTEDIPETNAFELLLNNGTHASNTAIEVRHKYRRFFCGVGQVPCQDAVISRGRKG